MYMTNMLSDDLEFYVDYYLDSRNSETKKYQKEYDAMNELVIIKKKLDATEKIDLVSINLAINNIMKDYCGLIEDSWNYNYYVQDIEYFKLSNVKNDERLLCSLIKLKNSFKLLYLKSLH